MSDVVKLHQNLVIRMREGASRAATSSPRGLDAALVVALLVSTACGIADDPALEEEGTEAEIVRNYELLDLVELDSGVRLEFGRMESGGIVVLEDAPVGEYSPMSTLMTGEQATPLELYLAVAPAERVVPEALVQSHHDFAVRNAIDPEPRALEFDPDLAFRTDYDWYYLADCDEPDDHGWFDDFWQTYGWSWHDYQRTNAFSTETLWTPGTHAVQVHLCNDGPNSSKAFFVRKTGLGYCDNGPNYSVFTKTVAAEYRSQFRAWEDPDECSYKGRASGPTSNPTYALGITMP